MQARIMRALLFGSIMLAVSGCATSQEWNDWLNHPSHYASFSHIGFSFRNTEGSAPRVTRADIEQARTEQWWGKVITVSPEQVIQQ